MVEDVTSRFQHILQAIQGALPRLLGGDPAVLQKSEVPWERWSPTRFAEVRLRLESIKPADYTLDDWLLVVDWLLQRYLGPDTIKLESEHITVRSALLGRIQANMSSAKPSNTPEHLADRWEFLPTNFGAPPRDVLTPLETSILRVAQARAAENIKGVSESERHRINILVLEHIQAQILGQKEGTSSALATRLFDNFGHLNLDFRRIAIDEMGEAVNQGFIASRPIGSKVRRLEPYQGGCEFCRSINGRVFTVVDPAAPVKDGETQVWVGKTNIGRGASPRMRMGNTLVERPAARRWWPAAGLIHSGCRGAWTPVTSVPANVNPEFAAWMKAKLDARFPETNRPPPDVS
jgi:hypothetical protein